MITPLHQIPTVYNQLQLCLPKYQLITEGKLKQRAWEKTNITQTSEIMTLSIYLPAKLNYVFIVSNWFPEGKVRAVLSYTHLVFSFSPSLPIYEVCAPHYGWREGRVDWLWLAWRSPHSQKTREWGSSLPCQAERLHSSEMILAWGFFVPNHYSCSKEGQDTSWGWRQACIFILFIFLIA